MNEASLEKLPERNKAISLYPGIDLFYVEADSLDLCHNAGESMQINYCKSGQMLWQLGNGNRIYLNPGDFSLHSMDTDSLVSFPTGQYSGLTICIDLREMAANLPELLKQTGIFQKNFCQSGAVSFLAGNEQTEGIFSGFYQQPENLKLPYQKLKVLELLLYLDKLEFTRQDQLPAYPSEQLEVIRKIHDRLIQNMGERITIEALAKQYHTIKASLWYIYPDGFSNYPYITVGQRRNEVFPAPGLSK